MGWHGDYENVEEVLEETKRGIDSKGYRLIDRKATKSYGLTLFETDKGDVYLDGFIFRDDMYKPISFLYDSLSRFKAIPKAWLNQLTDSGDIEQVKKQKDALKAEQKKPKLDDILIKGKTYLVWSEHEAIYCYKQKRSFVFRVDGEYVRFTNLKPEHVKLLS